MAPACANVNHAPDSSKFMIPIYESLNPRFVVLVWSLIVQHGNSLANISLCLASEELRFLVCVVGTIEVIVTEWNVVIDALLHKGIASLVNKADTFCGLYDAEVNTAICDIETCLPVANVNSKHNRLQN